MLRKMVVPRGDVNVPGERSFLDFQIAPSQSCPSRDPKSHRGQIAEIGSFPYKSQELSLWGFFDKTKWQCPPPRHAPTQIVGAWMSIILVRFCRWIFHVASLLSPWMPLLLLFLLVVVRASDILTPPSMGVEPHRLLPAQAQPAQVFHKCLGIFRSAAAGGDVLDAQQKTSAGLPRGLTGRERRKGVALVRQSRGARGKARDDLPDDGLANRPILRRDFPDTLSPPAGRSQGPGVPSLA